MTGVSPSGSPCPDCNGRGATCSECSAPDCDHTYQTQVYACNSCDGTGREKEATVATNDGSGDALEADVTRWLRDAFALADNGSFEEAVDLASLAVSEWREQVDGLRAEWVPS